MRMLYFPCKHREFGYHCILLRVLLTFDLAHEMADCFDEAMVYALGSIGKAGLSLKEEQRRAVRHIFDGKDTFVWLPTGFEKSIFFFFFFTFFFMIGSAYMQGYIIALC